MPLTFVRATNENQIFSLLRKEWDVEMEANGDAPPPGLYGSMMGYASEIIERRDGDPKYGIFALLQCDEDGNVLSYEAFAHISHKLPNTTDSTLRVLWNLLAPRHQLGERRSDELARIMTAIIAGAFDLSQGNMPAREVKVYLGNAIDREFVTIAALFLETRDASISFAVRGSWLHIAPR